MDLGALGLWTYMIRVVVPKNVYNRQDFITILTPETSRKDITTLNIRMFISIIIMLLKMNVKHGIKKHVAFADYITIHFLSV